MRIIKEINDAYHYSISRAQALIALQNGIDFLLGSEEDEDIFSYIKRKYEKSSDLIEIIEESFIEPMKEHMEEVGKEIENDPDKQRELERRLSEIDMEETAKAFKPLFKIIESVMMVYEDPLFCEAIIGSVSAFETYLKDTLVYLVSNNKVVEDRFHETLKKELDYEKVKSYNYDWDDILGHIVIESINFYDIDDVNRSYCKAFGKKKNQYQIYTSDNQKKRLQNYIRLRHLIIHNGGYIDHKFKNETKCKYKVGDLYPINKKYIIDMMGSMNKIIENIEDEIHHS